MPETATIYNHTDLDQHAYELGGKRHSLGPFEIRVVPTEVAQLFLAQRGKFVQPYVALALPRVPGEDLVWIANVTGDPFAPATVKVLYFDRDKNMEVEQEVPNPRYKARPITRKMNGQQTIQAAESGEPGAKESVSHPEITIKLPPFSRHSCSRSIADWLERRDAQQDELMVGSIKIVRAPTDYEPNDSWSQEEMLAYGELIDGTVDWRARWGVPQTGDGFQEEVRKVKIDLLNALFFKVIDERYSLPPREFVKAALAEKKAAQPQPKPQGQGQIQGKGGQPQARM